MTTRQAVPDSAYALSGLLFEAVEDERAWPTFLGAVARQCRAPVVMLFVHDYRRDRVPFAVGTGLDQQALVEYRERHGPTNPWVAAQAGMGAGSIVASHRLPCEPRLLSTSFHADFLKPHGLRYAIGSNILKVDGLAVKLGALRGAAAGPVDERELALFRQLMPALQTAMRLRQRLLDLASRATDTQAALDALGHGVYAVDDDLRVIWSNRAADELLRDRDGLHVDAGGRLAGATPDWPRVRHAVALAACAVDVAHGSTLRLSRPSGRRALAIQVLPAACGLVGDDRRSRALVFAFDPERLDPTLDRRLAAAFGLTPAEGRLAACLTQGLALREAAARLGITEGTARLVSSRIYAKTATRGQADLVRVLLKSVAT